MQDEPRITRFEVYEFEHQVRDRGSFETRPSFEPGSAYTTKGYGLKIHTSVGITGDYISGAQIGMVPRFTGELLGQNALEREYVYHVGKRLLRQQARFGLAPVDIAGKYFGDPIYKLLGGYRKRLPAYASTMVGDEGNGLHSP